MDKRSEAELIERLQLFNLKIEITEIYCFTVFSICNALACPALKFNRQRYLRPLLN